VVIVRNDLLGSPSKLCPKVLNWTLQAEKGSMLNTPPTYAVYMMGLCLKWLRAQGGVEAIEKVNIEKAKLLYDVLDDSKFYRAAVLPKYRSRMNVTFTTPSPEMDAEFVKAAAARDLVNLKGHRLVGGIRASIYNAMPIEGVRALVDFMKKFELENK
jgi:phosphoserine aminotransferase